MTVNDDPGAGVQPAHIVGCRSVDFDHGVRKPQRPQPLTGLACDVHMNRVVSGPPESAADAVLAISLNRQPPIPAGHRSLTPLFQDSGIQPDAIRFS